MHFKKYLFLVFVGAFSFSSYAFAQNTGGVFGPVVDEGHRAAEYRITYDSSNEKTSHRIHYQHSLNGSLMARGVAQARESDDRDFDFDYVQGELFWQITPDGQDWQTGMRFDARARSDNRSGLLGVHWTNQYQFSPKISGRVVALSFKEIGENARDDLALQSRTNLMYRPETEWINVTGIELYSAYGNTTDFKPFKNQSHQIGPFAMIRSSENTQLFTGALFGMTDMSSDQEWRFWLTRFF